MSKPNGNGQGLPTDLTDAILTARSGLRSDVQHLVDRLELGELYTPLARRLPGVPEGQQVELTDDLTLVPHMLIDADGNVFCALFTRPEFMEPLGARLNWNTDGGPLQYVAFPARTALDMTATVIDDEQVLGVVINAGEASELTLRRSEVGALLHGTAIPLVGYVAAIPGGAEGDTLEGISDAPPPKVLVDMIARCVAELPEISAFALRRTLNPERDLEPHLALHLKLASADADRGDLVATILDAIKDLLPPPGYIDIIFDD